MIPEDKLTRAERIRLEALARTQGMSAITEDNIVEMLMVAEKVEAWLKQAR